MAMNDDKVDIRIYFSGEFRRTTYVGGDKMLVPHVQVDEFSYTVFMEFLKEYLHFSEIGGVYTSKGIQGGWKLVQNDDDVLGHVFDCIADEEVEFYVDNVVDKNIKPLPQMQPHVILRPRKNIVQVSTKKEQKRVFVTTNQLQQQRLKKFRNKSPSVRTLKMMTASPNMLTTGRHESEEVRGSAAKRKLDLEVTCDDEASQASEDNAISEENLPTPQLVQLTDYEKSRNARIEQNKKKMSELGVKKIADGMHACALKNGGGKDKTKEGSDEYTPENESEHDSSVDTSERRKKAKKKKVVPAPEPRTRSRTNAIVVTENKVPDTATATENEPTHTGIEKEATQTRKAVTSSSGPKRVKPVCSTLLKQTREFEAAGSLSAYLAPREQQKKGLAHSTGEDEDVPEANMEEAATEEKNTVAPRKPRGRSKLEKVHGRSLDKRPVIKLNNRGQPISDDDKVVPELSRFLGTVVKDNVSLTHINWRLVPVDLKKKMWEYTRERFIIPEEGQKWVNTTLNESWRVYKARMKKKHYKQYETDDGGF